METTGLIAFLVIGAVAGWLAGTLMKGGALGFLAISSSVSWVRLLVAGCLACWASQQVE